MAVGPLVNNSCTYEGSSGAFLTFLTVVNGIAAAPLMTFQAAKKLNQIRKLIFLMPLPISKLVLIY